MYTSLKQTAVGLSDAKLALSSKWCHSEVLVWLSAQFLLTLPCKVHAFCVTKQLHFAVTDKQVS